MGRHNDSDKVEELDSNNVSVIIKDDCTLDTIKAESELNDVYDLEVQKPSERAKILSDSSFFKKLSYSFYSDSLRKSKSYSVLPTNHFLM